MLLFWRWREVYCGYSLEKLAEIRRTLTKNGIRYQYRARRHDAGPPFRAPARDLTGRMGENTAFSTLYYLYVPKAAYEEAAALLGGLAGGQ